MILSILQSFLDSSYVTFYINVSRFKYFQQEKKITEIIGFFSSHLFYSSASVQSIGLHSIFAHFGPPPSFCSTVSSVYSYRCQIPFSLVLLFNLLGFRQMVLQIPLLSGLLLKSLHVTVFGDNNHRTWKELVSPVRARHDLLYTNPS